MKRAKIIEHRDEFKRLVRGNQPAAIVIPVCLIDASMIQKHLSDLVDEVDKDFPFKLKPTVVLVDPTVSRLDPYDKRCSEDGVYRDLEKPSQRIAVSLVRFMQDPLAETCQLWHESSEENAMLHL